MIKDQKKDTALLVFSLSAREEARRKPLLGHARKDVTNNLFSHLIQETAYIAAASGVDVIWIDEKQQRGTNFAARFTNAFQELFDRGYENVISIGNDCPDLTVAMLRTAIDQLKDKKLVVGPATDGGVYLLGLNKSLFEAEKFLSLPWQQETLFSQISFHANREKIEFHCFNELSDIDNKAAVFAFVRNRPDSIIAQYIQFLFKIYFRIPESLDTCMDSLHIISAHTLRGPPFISSNL